MTARCKLELLLGVAVEAYARGWCKRPETGARPRITVLNLLMPYLLIKGLSTT